MKLLITGSTGFLGRHLAASAIARGHEVRAVVRPASDSSALGGLNERRLERVALDLRSPAGLPEAVGVVDAVIHAAALKSGDLYDQIASTVVGTEHLLAAMVQAGVRRLVHVSTISVYDFLHKWDYSRLDENAPLERRPERRETYAQSKLLQEDLVRREVDEHDLDLTIVRPGVIYGPDNMWTDQLGVRTGGTLLRFASFGRLPVTYVENCADAIVRCAEEPAAIGETFNLVDSDLPTRRWFVREMCRRMDAPPRVVPVPAIAARAAARTAEVVNMVFFGGAARTPWLLAPAKLHVQVKPLRYTNRHICEVLGWEPAIGPREAMDRCFARTPSTDERPPVSKQVSAAVAERSA